MPQSYFFPWLLGSSQAEHIYFSSPQHRHFCRRAAIERPHDIACRKIEGEANLRWLVCCIIHCSTTPQADVFFLDKNIALVPVEVRRIFLSSLWEYAGECMELGMVIFWDAW